jgi:hypothetical protein
VFSLGEISLLDHRSINLDNFEDLNLESLAATYRTQSLFQSWQYGTLMEVRLAHNIEDWKQSAGRVSAHARLHLDFDPKPFIEFDEFIPPDETNEYDFIEEDYDELDDDEDDFARTLRELGYSAQIDLADQLLPVGEHMDVTRFLEEGANLFASMMDDDGEFF